MVRGFDGMLQGVDDAFNRILGDGADPQMAPPGQHTMDPWSVLGGLPSCEVTEKASLVEALSAFAGADHEVEMPNKYKVIAPNGQQAFFIAESTDLCTRQAQGCCADCARWDVDMRVVNSQGEAEEAFKLSRPWTCTCCCFNRPTVTIVDAQSGEEVARMVDPCTCCNMTFSVNGKDGDHLMDIKGGCCQWGLCCPLPCGPCARVHFTAEDKDGNQVGQITKRTPSMIKFIASPDVDNYQVDFEGSSDALIKLVLIAASVFIDFRYFSFNQNAKDSDGDHIPDRFDFQDGGSSDS